MQIERPIPVGIEIQKHGKTFEIIDVLEDYYLLEEIGVEVDNPYVHIPKHQLESNVKYGFWEYRGEMEPDEQTENEPETEIIAVETIGNYRRVTLRERSLFIELNEPTETEQTTKHSKGSKSVMGITVNGKELLQAVLVKTQAGGVDYAKETALDIKQEVEN